MVDIIADLHLHSKYSRAVSPHMTLPVMAQFGEQKGIELLATGDFTHPMWFSEIRSFLLDAEEGLYKIKKPIEGQNEKTRFLLSVEIATIFSQKGKGRRIHQIVLVPSFEVAAKVNKELIKQGCNLSSDGRPIIGLSSKNLLQLLLAIDERCLLIPAHIWTPWFGIYGKRSGFESLTEAFDDLSQYVYGIETGLSSDPEMNWQVKELTNRSILSFSDAHSSIKMGREATVFRLEDVSFANIRKAIMAPSQKVRQKTQNKVLYTVEFYPEEGKYHYSGHRNCKISMTPQKQIAAGNICPVCDRQLTDGVMRRVQELAARQEQGNHVKNGAGVVWITDPKNIHPPFVKIVPLQEIIAESISSSINSQKVKVIFDKLCKDGLSEFHVLLKLPFEDIEKIAQSVTSLQFAKRIKDGIGKVRSEQIVIQPGYDGVFGTVKIWQKGKDVAKDIDEEYDSEKHQIGLQF